MAKGGGLSLPKPNTFRRRHERNFVQGRLVVAVEGGDFLPKGVDVAASGNLEHRKKTSYEMAGKKGAYPKATPNIKRIKKHTSGLKNSFIACAPASRGGFSSQRSSIEVRSTGTPRNFCKSSTKSARIWRCSEPPALSN